MKTVSDSLVLGAAQLGMPYGIANEHGQPDQDKADEIVKTAWDLGIRKFDTAQAYGSSEAVLGKAIKKLGDISDIQIISKFDPELNHLEPELMHRALEGSLQKLGVSRLYCIMLHSEKLFALWHEGLSEIFQEFTESGKIDHAGVSFYTPQKALEALDSGAIDVIQVPANILDRRFAETGVIDLAEKKNVTVFVRSVFLQGILSMRVEEIPDNMLFAGPVVGQVRRCAEELYMPVDEMVIGYIKRKMPEAKIIFGAETFDQVVRNVSCWRKDIQDEALVLIEKMFNDIDEIIIRPDYWPI